MKTTRDGKLIKGSSTPPSSVPENHPRSWAFKGNPHPQTAQTPRFQRFFLIFVQTAKKKMAVFQLLGVFPWGFRDQPALSSLQKQPRCDKTSKVFFFGRSFWTYGFAKPQLEVDWKTRRFFDKKNIKGLYATMLCEFPIFLHSTGFLAPY